MEEDGAEAEQGEEETQITTTIPLKIITAISDICMLSKMKNKRQHLQKKLRMTLLRKTRKRRGQSAGPGASASDLSIGQSK